MRAAWSVRADDTIGRLRTQLDRLGLAPNASANGRQDLEQVVVSMDLQTAKELVKLLEEIR